MWSKRMNRHLYYVLQTAVKSHNQNKKKIGTLKASPCKKKSTSLLSLRTWACKERPVARNYRRLLISMRYSDLVCLIPKVGSNFSLNLKKTAFIQRTLSNSCSELFVHQTLSENSSDSVVAHFLPQV